ncbi:retrovirus-related pol polyprotein from transposon TNT 1-94 [Tanacetum coccineum]
MACRSKLFSVCDISGCSKHMDQRSCSSRATKFVNLNILDITLKFGNDHVTKILGYSDYQIGNVTILRVYYVEGLGHNLFSVGKFCDSNLEVAFRQHTFFIRNLEEAIATACYTQNHSIIRLHHGKTSYELLHDKLLDLFVNQTLREYYEKVDISPETSVARSPQQRRNRMLIEAARTMLIYAKAPLFLWAEAIANAYFDELTAMASEHSSLEPVLSEMTPATIRCEEDNHDLDVTHMNNDPFFGIQILENNSKASSSSDVIPTIVQTAAPYSEHVTKWTKDHPLDNIINKIRKHDQEARSESERINQREMRTEHTNNSNGINTVSTPVSTTGPSFDTAVPSTQVNTAGPSVSTANESEEQLFESLVEQIDTYFLLIVLFTCFLSIWNPEPVQALKDPSWVEAMQDELLQFKLLKVWTLVDLPRDKWQIGTKWVFRNKKDERGIVVINKARLVGQGHTQEEGIDYDKVLASLSTRIKPIKIIFWPLCFSFKDFVVYQMDVKSAFLYGKIEEEV